MVSTRSGSQTQSASGYQPFEAPTPLGNRISSVTSTLDTMQKMLDGLDASSEFEKGIKAYLGLLHSQVIEIKVEQAKLRDEMLVRNHNVRASVDDLTLSVVKTEQYSRRDTVTVVGLPKPDGSELQADLCKKVASILSLSGETVTVSDLSAVHRNSAHSKLIRNKTVPPSVTVRFCRINKKDNVLRGYRNYDTTQGRPRETKAYQSLTPHYSTLRNTIYEFLNSNPSDNKDFGNIVNHAGMKPKWVTYQSPTSGFAVKLASGEYFKGIHMWADFVGAIWDKFPACRGS